jgi:hypothetical protein
VSTIDLESGEPDPDESPAARRRRERRSSSGSSGGSSSSGRSRSSSNSDDSGLVTRMDAAWVKIANQIAARGDDELAEAIIEEHHPMSVGLVSLTSTLTVFRWPLVILMALVEPLLAFWRVGRLVFIRFLGWRERRIIAAQEAAQQAEWEAGQAHPQPMTDVPVA